MGEDLEFHVAKEHPARNFAETSSQIIIDIKDENDDSYKTVNGFVKMDPVIASLGQNLYSSVSCRRSITSNRNVQDEFEEQIETITIQLTKGEISVLMENNREILESNYQYRGDYCNYLR